MIVFPAASLIASSGSSFLDIPVGARPAALGSAYAALAQDAYTPVWNPAGLGFLSTHEVAAQHLTYLESIHYEFISGVVPFKDHSGLGVAIQYLGSGDITGRDNNANPTGDFSTRDTAYTLAYGRRLGTRWSAGLAFKGIDSRLDDVHAQAYSVDLGAQALLRDDLTWAFTASNLGTRLTFIDEATRLPLTFRSGFAYRPTRQWTFATEGAVRRDGPESFHGGVEWRFIPLAALRAGYRSDMRKELDAWSGVSAGLGIEAWGQEFSYAWVPYGDLGQTQYFSFLFRWGDSQDPSNLKRARNLDLRLHSVEASPLDRERVAARLERDEILLLIAGEHEQVASGRAIGLGVEERP